MMDKLQRAVAAVDVASLLAGRKPATVAEAMALENHRRSRAAAGSQEEAGRVAKMSGDEIIRHFGGVPQQTVHEVPRQEPETRIATAATIYERRRAQAVGEALPVQEHAGVDPSGVYARRAQSAGATNRQPLPVDSQYRDQGIAADVYADRSRQVAEITRRSIAAASSRGDAAKVGSNAYADSVYVTRQGAVAAHIAAMRDEDNE